MANDYIHRCLILRIGREPVFQQDTAVSRHNKKGCWRIELKKAGRNIKRAPMYFHSHTEFTKNKKEKRLLLLLDFPTSDSNWSSGNLLNVTFI